MQQVFAWTLGSSPRFSPSCTRVPAPQPQCSSPALKMSAPASSVSGSPAWQSQSMQSSVGHRNNRFPPQLRDSAWAQAPLPLTLHSPATAPSPQPFKSFAASSLFHSRNVLLSTAASIPVALGFVLPWLYTSSPGDGMPQLIPSPWIRAGRQAASCGQPRASRMLLLERTLPWNKKKLSLTHV